MTLAETYDGDLDFLRILDGNNDMPRIIRGYPAYYRINRRIYSGNITVRPHYLQ